MRLNLVCVVIFLCGLGAIANGVAASEPMHKTQVSASVSTAAPVHGIAMHGTPKYPADFKHFDYVNPAAPKGGTLRQASFGSFDTFNPFVIKGNSAPGSGMVFETLGVQSMDEPFSIYGLIAQKIEMPENRQWVAFHIHPDARFSDGSVVTAEDVVFSFHILREKGIPQYRYYYADVQKVSYQGNRVLFEFKEGDNRELPLILGQMPVLSKHYWQNKDFTQTTLEPPVGSGPYILKDFDLNRSITYQRNPDYWGKDLPVNKGLNNFDEIRYDVYRDTTIAVEAFKAGSYDIRVENEAKKWATAYDFPAVEDGKVKKREIHHGLPSGMQGFVFNTRRPIFQDKRVREALSYALNFDWINKNLFYDSYMRTTSFFDNSDLGAHGLPDEKEVALLKKVGAAESILSTPLFMPQADMQNPRPQLMHALNLLNQAGWSVQDGILKNKKGEAFTFEMLLDSSGAGAWERIVLPFKRLLGKIGIDMRIRVMDALQYKNRLDSFDFDMFVMVWAQSLSPGNEQRYYWGSATADQKGSYNFAGIKDKVVDDLIEAVVQAQTRTQLTTATKALDRVLLNGHYVIAHWYSPMTRVIYWDKFEMPDAEPMQGISLMTWWVRE